MEIISISPAVVMVRNSDYPTFINIGEIKWEFLFKNPDGTAVYSRVTK